MRNLKRSFSSLFLKGVERKQDTLSRSSVAMLHVAQYKLQSQPIYLLPYS